LLAELSKLARAWQKARGEARDPRRSEDDGEERDSARRNGLRGGDGKGHRTETSAATERTRGRHARTGKEKRVDGD
jgi:hypothetical protein